MNSFATEGQATGSPPPLIVLVHGAFVDASGWQQVYIRPFRDQIDRPQFSTTMPADEQHSTSCA